MRPTTTRSLATTAAIAGALVLADPAAAQDARLARSGASPDVRLESRLDAGTRAAVVALVDSARARRLPVEPLVDKALEGASKHAAPEKILSAVRALATSLERSRAVLGPNASDADVVAGASALRAGVDPSMLRQLREQRARESMTVALGVLTELVARGASADTVARTLVLLRDAGARDADLLEFRRDVEYDIASGVASPTVAVTTRADGFVGPIGTARDATPRKRKP